MDGQQDTSVEVDHGVETARRQCASVGLVSVVERCVGEATFAEPGSLSDKRPSGCEGRTG
jgi:hypothetical protein